MRYESHADGTVGNGIVFFDMTSPPGKDALDGVKVDQRGNLYVSAPGGMWIISPEGKVCARSGLYKMRLNIPGVRP